VGTTLTPGKDAKIMQNYCLRKLKLWPDEWAAIDRIAQELHACARSGGTNLRPTWAAPLRGIARGEYIVTVAKPKPALERQIEALDRAIAANEEKEAEQRAKASAYTQLNILEAAEPA
jgi:hypothetical protein